MIRALIKAVKTLHAGLQVCFARHAHRVPHAQVVHLEHLLVWASRSISSLHIASGFNVLFFTQSALLGVPSALRERLRRIQAKLLNSFHLLLAFILPRPHVVVRSPILQALQHSLIVVEDPIYFTVAHADVQAIDSSCAIHVTLLSLTKEMLGTFRPLFFVSRADWRTSIVTLPIESV